MIRKLTSIGLLMLINLQNSSANKLKILSLHGAGGSADQQEEYNTQLPKDYGDILDFYYLDGPNDAPNEKMQDGKSWAKQVESEVEGEKGTEDYSESYQYLADYLTENGPFDGFINFSQGTIVSTRFFKTAELFEKQEWIDLFPKFVIQMGGPNMLVEEIYMEGEESVMVDFSEDKNKIQGVKALILLGQQDIYGMYNIIRHQAAWYKCPQIMYHEGGHEVPTSLSQEEADRVYNFLNTFYAEKFNENITPRESYGQDATELTDKMIEDFNECDVVELVDEPEEEESTGELLKCYFISLLCFTLIIMI